MTRRLGAVRKPLFRARWVNFMCKPPTKKAVPLKVAYEFHTDADRDMAV